MGWGNCGEDSKGRPIGYMHAATCDHEGCNEEIDRGLAYACGGMHGKHEHDCEGYFCQKHLTFCEDPEEEGQGIMLCQECTAELEKVYGTGDFVYNIGVAVPLDEQD